MPGVSEPHGSSRSNPRLWRFPGLYELDYIAGKVSDFLDDQSAAVYIGHRPAIDVSPRHAHHQGSSQVHYEAQSPFLAQDVLQEQHLPSGLAHSPEFGQPQHGVRHGAKHKSGHDRIEAIVRELEALAIHELQADLYIPSGRPLPGTGQHPVAEVHGDYISPGWIVREVLSRANSHLQNPFALRLAPQQRPRAKGFWR